MARLMDRRVARWSWGIREASRGLAVRHRRWERAGLTAEGSEERGREVERGAVSEEDIVDDMTYRPHPPGVGAVAESQCTRGNLCDAAQTVAYIETGGQSEGSEKGHSPRINIRTT